MFPTFRRIVVAPVLYILRCERIRFVNDHLGGFDALLSLVVVELSVLSAALKCVLRSVLRTLTKQHPTRVPHFARKATSNTSKKSLSSGACMPIDDGR